MAAHHVVLLDTVVFAYHLADHPQYAGLTSLVLGEVEAGRLEGLTTSLTLAKLLTLPAQARDEDALLEYELFVRHFPNLRLVSLDIALARETARVRGEFGLRTPDAVQVAAARLHGADGIVTNDRRWAERVSSPPVLLLDSFLE